MTDKATRICDELEVCREEAILYLEAFDWNLDAAMEACRSNTLDFPSLTPEKEKSSSEEVTSSLPSTSGSLPSPNQSQLIVKFYEVATGSDIKDAKSYLERNDWDLERAVSQFFDERRPTPSQRKLNRHSQGEEASEAADTLVSMRDDEQIPEGLTRLKIQESTSSVPVKESAEVLPSSMSTSQLANTPEEQLSQRKEEIIKSFCDVATGASREAAKACLSYCKWNQDDAVSYFFGDYTESKAHSHSKIKAVEEEDSSTESLEEAGEGYIPEAKSHVKVQSLPEQPSQWKDEVDLFVEWAGGVVNRDVATIYLTHSNWNVEKALSCLLEERSQVQTSHGSRNKGYLEEDETGSSSSSSNPDDPTETENDTVAIPGVASSQVGENVKDKDVEEDLGTELPPVPITATTIELEIILDDGGSGTQVWILVRSDQTVRDIHNRIDVFRPEDKRDYYFKSDTGVEYRDLDTTVHNITSGSRGSTTLHQIYST